MRPKTIVFVSVMVLVVAGLVALFALIHSPAAQAQSGNFEIAQHGHAVGTASFTLTPKSRGYDSSSLVRVTMKGLDYSLSKTERLSSAKHLVNVQLSATVNGSAAMAMARPESGHIVLNMSANGRKVATNLPAHESAVFLPDFDPGALETLLALGSGQNNRDLWVIVPKNSGSVDAVQMATLPDLQGTLDGKAISVHHLEATIAGAKTELFSGPENQLLQAELPQEGFALVRKGFVLQPPAKAPAPPPSPAGQTQAPPAG